MPVAASVTSSERSRALGSHAGGLRCSTIRPGCPLREPSAAATPPPTWTRTSAANDPAILCCIVSSPRCAWWGTMTGRTALINPSWSQGLRHSLRVTTRSSASVLAVAATTALSRSASPRATSLARPADRRRRSGALQGPVIPELHLLFRCRSAVSASIMTTGAGRCASDRCGAAGGFGGGRSPRGGWGPGAGEPPEVSPAGTRVAGR